jgi:hypothetical protein
MKYAILVYETAEEFAERDDAVRKSAYWGAHAAYVAALRDRGMAAGGAGLMPPTSATTVRVRGGSRQVADGPYAETKEQLGGFYLIEAPDLDAALDWAARCPSAARGAAEVRPVLDM